MTTTQDQLIERSGPGLEPPGRGSAYLSSILLLAGTILLPISGLVHPAPSPDEVWEIGNAAMLADDAFEPARLLEITSLVTVAAALAMIARSPMVRGLAAMRTALVAVVAAMVIAVVDQVLFILAANEANDLLAGGSTPFFDTHLIVQAVLTPILGSGIAVLAVLDARRSPRWTWIPAAIGVVGGIVGGTFGPLLAITRDLSSTAVGAGWVLVGFWLLVTAIRRLVDVRRGRDVALT